MRAPGARRVAEVISEFGCCGCRTGHAAKFGTKGGTIGVDISAELLPLAVAKGWYGERSGRTGGT